DDIGEGLDQRGRHLPDSSVDGNLPLLARPFERNAFSCRLVVKGLRALACREEVVDPVHLELGESLPVERQLLLDVIETVRRGLRITVAKICLQKLQLPLAGCARRRRDGWTEYFERHK